MNESPASSCGPEGGFRAVQQDVSVTCVDWQVFHARGVADEDFTGAVTILDRGGRQIGFAGWEAPTDEAADACLSALGWARVDHWKRDDYGRRAAAVIPAGAQREAAASG